MKLRAYLPLLVLLVLAPVATSGPQARSTMGHSDIPGLVAAEGLEATLFAESPMLTSPTNLDVDDRGRVWVLEGHNYRTTLHPNNPVRPEGDRILILEDTTGDGKADVQKVFYQGRDIDAAMGIAVLGNRVVVSAYENVFVFTDTNGDDVADTKELLFTFNRSDHDHTVHAFVFGPDGRLYFNVGDEGKVVMDAGGNVIVDRAGNRVTGEGEPYRKGMVFRAEMDGSNFEVLGHNFRNPYELALDSYGSLWQSDNDDDGNRGVRINFVMEYGNYGYTDEVTGAGWTTPRTGMSDSIPLRHWFQNDPGVVPNLLQTGAGSPAGIMFYEGDLLPPVYQNAMIHAEPGLHVVRAYPAEPHGAGFRARTGNILRGDGDRLFRPVDVAAAPDGSLFIADWYDQGVGGHLVANQTQGRIIRVAPKDTPYRVTPASYRSPRDAARALQSPNHATRYRAYSALESMGRRAERELVRMWRGNDQRFRARALWLLAQLPGRGDRYIDQAIRDPNPDVRITGLRAVRRTGREVIPHVTRLVNDPSPAVRREAAIALRHDPNPAAAALWARLALQHDGADRWYLEALGIAADRQWDRFFAAWLEQVGDPVAHPAGRDLVWRARTDASIPHLAGLVRDVSTPRVDRLRYFRGFDFHSGAERERTLASLLDGDHPDQPELTALALTHLDAPAAAGSPQVRAALGRTLDASFGTPRFVDLARRFDARDRLAQLVEMALAQPDETVGVAAARLALSWNGIGAFGDAVESRDPERTQRALVALGHAGGADAHTLLEHAALDSRQPLAQRQVAVRSLGRNQTGERTIVAWLEAGRLPKELEETAGSVLFASFRGETREAAARFLRAPEALTADGRTLPPIPVLARQRGDAEQGRAVFARACASCHQAEGSGIEFGPNLSQIGAKLPRAALYNKILDPNAGVGFNYMGHLLRLRDGTEIVGIITSETATEATLRTMGGISQRYAKAEIAARQPLPNSLMPAGLERTMTERELINLVEYLAALGR